MQSFHQNLKYLQLLLTFSNSDQAFSDEMQIFINVLHFIQIPAPHLISLRQLGGSVKKKKIHWKKVPCKKYFGM